MHPSCIAMREKAVGGKKDDEDKKKSNGITTEDERDKAIRGWGKLNEIE